jgi:hypothetical protein
MKRQTGEKYAALLSQLIQCWCVERIYADIFAHRLTFILVRGTLHSVLVGILPVAVTVPYSNWIVTIFGTAKICTEWS